MKSNNRNEIKVVRRFRNFCRCSKLFGLLVVRHGTCFSMSSVGRGVGDRTRAAYADGLNYGTNTNCNTNHVQLVAWSKQIA